jgi:hypothetical protein
MSICGRCDQTPTVFAGLASAQLIQTLTAHADLLVACVLALVESFTVRVRSLRIVLVALTKSCRCAEFFIVGELQPTI